MMASVSGSMLERTGRTLESWCELVETHAVVDPLDQKAVRGWLKDEHGVRQNSQWAIAFEVATRAGWVQPDVDGYVNRQYEGPRAALRPIFDVLRQELTRLGDDVSVEGRSGYTPFVRRRQFAAVAAATRTRVDLGLRFTDAPASVRLTETTSLGQSTHKLGLTSVEDVTADAIALARAAYD